MTENWSHFLLLFSFPYTKLLKNRTIGPSDQIGLIHDTRHLCTHIRNDGKILVHVISQGAKNINNMAVDAVSKWKVDELNKFLKDRGAVNSGR